MSWFLMPLRKYATFSGRSRRKEYWMFVLFIALITLALSLLDVSLGTYDDEAGIGLFQGIFSLATLLPYLALSSRRLHDTGKSGWRQLFFLIPIVGLILWLIWMAAEGDHGPNNYGPDPKVPESLLANAGLPA